MARRLVCAVVFGILVCTSTVRADNGHNVVQRDDRAKVVILGAIAGVELLLIFTLLRRRSMSRAAEAALLRKEERLRGSEDAAKAARAEFSRKLIQAQEKERARIARELHDDINQRMALLANGVERAIQAHGDDTRADQTQELRELWRLANEIATDIQHLSHQLHPSKLHYLGLATAVRDVCNEFARQHQIDVDCNVQRLPSDLDEAISLSLFRTVQESLRNIAKHSQARRVEVELIHELAGKPGGESGTIQLRVSDDGVGFDLRRSENSSGLGLVSMRERLRSAGGEFRLSSSPGNGTIVEGTVPAIPKRKKAAYAPVS